MTDGGSREGSKGNAVRARLVRNAAAAPATVGGEPPTTLPLGTLAFLGRWSEAVIRKPGDLPPPGSRARIERGVSMTPSRAHRTLCVRRERRPVARTEVRWGGAP